MELPKSRDRVVKRFGFNSRLDNMHAAVALIGLKQLDEWINQRRKIANFYCKNLGYLKHIKLPPSPDEDKRYYDTYNSLLFRQTIETN